MANLDSHRATKVNITSSVSSSATLSPSNTSPTPHSFGFHDEYVPENNATSSKRILDLKRPPPLTLTLNTVPNIATSPKVAQSTTPLSAPSITPSKLNSNQIGTSPKYGSSSSSSSASKVEPSKISPSHPYYSGVRQYGTNSPGSRIAVNDSVPVFTSPTTVSSSGIPSGRKNFKPTLNLAGTGPLNEPPLRSKPSLHAIQKRQSKVYTREQLQELVQMRATETKMEDISEEHRAAIKKFNEDKASILKCGELSISDLEKQKELGFGNSGNVSKKRHIPSRVIMACKTIKLEIKEAQRNAILSELHVLHDCNSPYIVGFFGSFCYNMDLEICMEFMDGGSLDQVIRHWGRIQEDVIAVITRAVLHGMNYLFKELNILHRDVKPSNILINTLGEVKMCDFGVSKKLLDTKGVANSFVGTRSYMAPERLKGSDYSLKSDLWSLGISLIEMAVGNYPIPPLSDHQIATSLSLPPAGCDEQSPLPPNHLDHPIMAPFEMLQYVAMEEPPSLPHKYFSYDLCEFVESCLKRDPDKRASVEKLIQHVFITTDSKVDMATWVVNVSQGGAD